MNPRRTKVMSVQSKEVLSSKKKRYGNLKERSGRGGSRGVSGVSRNPLEIGLTPEKHSSS